MIDEDPPDEKSGEREKQVDTGPGKFRARVQPAEPGASAGRQVLLDEMVPQHHGDGDAAQSVEGDVARGDCMGRGC